MKSKHIQIRISEENKAEAKQKASLLGLSISSYIIMLIKKDNK